MRKLSMRKISEVLRLRFEQKLTFREIASSQNMSASTVSDYLARAKVAGISWPLPADLTEQELYNKLFLPSRDLSHKRAQPEWDMIYRELRKKGVTLQLLWREYRAAHPDGFGYSQFCNYYQAYAKTLNPVMRQVHKAGAKTFVDYAGMKMPWLDLKSGEILEAEIFVGCLGASQYIFAEATRSQQLADWLDSHAHLFEFFGGVTEMIVPDNLKSGVKKAHRYDPDLNANYHYFCEHYGVAIVPARAATPRDKAKVESAVSIVERQILAPLRNHTFVSLGEINDAIKKGLMQINHQPFQKMKTSRYELYQTLDKPALKPLPTTRYQYADYKKVKVSLDYHVAFDEHYYSVPHHFIGKKIEIRATNKMVECFAEQQRIALHARSYEKYQFTTQEAHMPKAHQAHKQCSEGMLKNWAHQIGPQTLAFIEHLMNARAVKEQAYRVCLGVLRLSKPYGEQRLEKACQKGLNFGATRYQQIELFLKNNLEEETTQTQPILAITTEHDNIRGSLYYQ